MTKQRTQNQANQNWINALNDYWLEIIHQNSIWEVINPATSDNQTNWNQISQTVYRDWPQLDAFARLRISNPFTLLDVKQTTDNLPLFFDDREVSGTGTSSVYNTNQASSTISVSADTAWMRVRQSKLWGSYQPWKSMLVILTWVLWIPKTWITKRIGYFNEENWLFFQSKDNNISVWVRSFTSQEAVDTNINQSDWNLDKLDWTWASWINLDFTKTQIFFLDFEWLWVWRVRYWFFIDWKPYYCHEQNFANNLDVVYMSNPNCPIRYEISNDWTWEADELVQICWTIVSEWWQEATALQTYVSRNGTPITLANQDLFTPIASIRLKEWKECSRVNIESVELLLTTNTNFEYAVFLNPTIAWTDLADFTWITNSAVELDITRDNTNTLSWWHIISWWYGSSTNQVKVNIAQAVKSYLTMWSNIDWSKDELVLAIKNVDWNWWTAYGWFTLREYC